MNESFLRLGPEWVLRAVEAAGLRPTGRTTALTCLENRVHDVELEDGAHVVVKFYRPGRWSREAILEEHAFLRALREAEIPVCAPIAFVEEGEAPASGGADGRTLHEAEGIFYAVWPRTGGRSPSELSDEECAVLGRLLARIHNVGEALAPVHRPRLDAESFGREPLAFLEQAGFLPPACARRYRAAALEAASLYTAWSAGVPVHAIHGDCHFGNLLNGPEGFFFLDFDDFVVGPAVQDVWMLLPGRDAFAARQRDVLISAYAQFRAFDPRWLRLVEPLRALRFVRYAAWIARRWSDPAFPSAFPHFGTHEYWENETRDLEEQVERIARGRGDDALPDGVREPAASDTTELTNKDFFWDL